jgi:hypothetical protein
MASEAQVLANRKNAQKSTGPRTEEGKAASAQNAVKHGLLARGDVIKTEDQADYDRMREKMVRELDPVGAVETELAERIVSLMWRLKRAQRLGNEVFDYLLAKDAHACKRRIYSTSANDPCEDPDFTLGRVAVEDLSNSRVIERLGLYERRIESSLYRTMRELRTVKALRVAEAGDCGEMADMSSEAEASGAELQTSDSKLDTSRSTPYGVTTNGELCETNPIGLGSEKADPDTGLQPASVNRAERDCLLDIELYKGPPVLKMTSFHQC